MATSVDVVVIGAGPAGLAAAWRAATRGFSVRVLERLDRVGGLSASFDFAGIRVDLGSHRLFPGTPARVLRDVRKLLGDDLQTRPFRARLRIDGTWVDYPLRAGDLARSLPLGLAAGIARDALAAPLRRSRDETYEEHIRVGLGPTVYRAVYGPYARKLWGLPGHRLSAALARQRVQEDTAWALTRRSLGRRRGADGDDVESTFHYPRAGFGQLTDRLRDAAVAAGAEVLLNCEVDHVQPTFDDVGIWTTDGTAFRAGIALSTLPLPALARITTPGPSLSAIEAAARLQFRAKVLVYLEHLGGRWTDRDAHLFPVPRSPVTRISEPTNYRDFAEDPSDRSAICAELPCQVGDEVWSAGDDELATMVEQVVSATDLPPLRRGSVLVRRLPYVYPVHELGYEARLAGIDAWIAGVPQLVTFGRPGLFTHDNSQEAMLEAYEAVDCLRADGTFDLARWRARKAELAGHDIED